MYALNAFNTTQIYIKCCWTFTKNKARNQKFKETRDTRYIFWKELYKAFFRHDMAHGGFKDLPSDKEQLLIKYYTKKLC